MKQKITFLFALLFTIMQANAQPLLNYKELASTAVYKGDKQLVTAGFVVQSVSEGTTATVHNDGYLSFTANNSKFYMHRATPQSGIAFNPTGNYTIEFRARIATGTGSWRGMDFSLNDGVGKAKNTFYLAHYRLGEVADDPTMIDYRPLTHEFHTIRVAVERSQKKVHIYENGNYLATKNLIDSSEDDNVYFQFGKGHSAAEHTIDIDYIAIDQTGAYSAVDPTTTPVTLTKLSVIKEYAGIKLVWETSSESNNSHFVVERSNDGVSFISVGNSLVAKGPSVYSVTDNNPIVGDNFYRLTQYDNNGDKEVFPVQYCKFDLSSKAFSIYPNPLANNEEFNISNVSNGKVKIAIYDLLGKKVLEDEKYITNGVFKTRINNLRQGVYYLKISDNTHEESSKIIIE